MNLYNYVAGGTFPPGLPEGFNEWKFGRSDVAIFVLERDERSGIGGDLAADLQTSRDFRGLVFSYTPENRDYLKCAEFFQVPAVPCYIAVTDQTFAEFFQLGASSEFRKFYSRSERYIECLVINGDMLMADRADGIGRRILEYARSFVAQNVSARTAPPLAVIKRLSVEALSAMRMETEPLLHSNEIAVLFTRPAWRHTNFERRVYQAFTEFGSTTDDVWVRVFYPSHIANDYERLVGKYRVLKLPAALFISPKSGRTTYKVERDLLQRIAEPEDRLRYVISDLHRAITSRRPAEGRELLRQLEADSGMVLRSGEVADSTEGRIIHIHVGTLVGDVVLGDKHQGDSV